MRKGIIYFIIINLLRLLVILVVGQSEGNEHAINIAATINSTSFQPTILATASFDNPFIDPDSLAANFLGFGLTLLLQLVFLLFLSNIVRNNKKYWIWIMLISSMMISPWVHFNFFELCFLNLWLLAIHYLYQAIFCKQNMAWIISALFVGIGLIIKNYMITIPIGMIIFLIFSTKYRDYIFTIWPYLFIVIVYVVTAPFLHDFIDLTSYLPNRLTFGSPESEGMYTLQFGKFALRQLALLMPVLFVGLWWLLFKYFGRIINKPNQVNSEFWFLLCFFIPMYLGVYIIAFFYSIPAEQLIPIYLIGLVIFGKLMKRRWVFWHIGLNLSAYAILLGLMLIDVFYN